MPAFIDPPGFAPDLRRFLRSHLPRWSPSQRFLVFALGSTAVKIAWNVRSYLFAAAPQISESVGFLCLDAAGQDSTEFLPQTEFIHLAVEDVETLMAHLDGHTILKSELPGLRSVEAIAKIENGVHGQPIYCLLYTSDAADE